MNVMNSKKRLQLLRKVLFEKELDAILISSITTPESSTIPNVYYFTGFYDVWPTSILLTKAAETLFTFEKDKAETATDIRNIVDLKAKKISDYLKEMNGHGMTIGIDGNVDYNYYSALLKKLPKCRLVDISKEISQIRAIKDDAEITEIKNACLLADRVLNDLVSEGLEDKSEKQISERIKQLIVGCGKEWSFPILVAGDEGSSYIHGTPTTRKFKDLVLIDMGIKSSFYNSDISRTFIFSNDPEMKKAYSDLVDVHKLLENEIVPGMSSDDVDALAKSFLEKNGHKHTNYSNFHGLGHGVGLEVHEYPTLSSKTSFVLKKNMVFTLEPAIYVKGKFGIRLEDTVVLGSKGIDRLNKYEFDVLS
ncbi:MAG: Xaa-Pro peptidase family protein [archaeon]